jgi:WD40 repeat protein
MPASDCPDRDCLRELLSGPAPENPELAHHLETCVSCQQTLESLAASAQLWAQAPEHLAKPASCEPGLERILHKLHSGGGDTAPAGGRGALPDDFLAPPEQAGQLGRLAHYDVLDILGWGGMGVVLRALDTKLNRAVALKVLAPELARQSQARERFVREAQAAAAVRNDHVVAIHAVEEAGGLPYLVLDHVRGVSLQERLDREGPLPIDDVLRIGSHMAQGLAAAHAQGLVHRDVKPANILLEEGSGRAAITDFGLAQAVDQPRLTHSGVVAGTPLYMAPEQSGGGALDARADLFSLGSVLYAMCAGRPPFQASTMLGVMKVICEEAPTPLRELRPDIPEELEAIIRRLHAKDPAERLQSAAEVAELLVQLLAHRENPARPKPVIGLLGRGGARHWPWVTGVIVLLLAGLALTEATGVTRFGQTIIRIVVPDGTLVVEVNDPKVSVTVEGDRGLRINGAGPQEIHLRPGDYRLEASKDGKLVHKELVNIRRGDTTTVTVRLEPAAQTAAAAAHGIRRFEGHTKDGVFKAAFSPDGTRILSGGSDTVLRLWDVKTGKELRRLSGHRLTIYDLAFLPGGRQALSCGEDGTMRLWDLDAGTLLRTFEGHTRSVRAMAVSQDGRRVLTASSDKTVRLWDVTSGKEMQQLEGHQDRVASVAFLDQERAALSAGLEGVMILWDLAKSEPIRRFEGHKGQITSIAVSADGRRALSAGTDRTRRLWEVSTGKELACWHGHAAEVRSVVFSANGARGLSASNDETIRLWEIATGKEIRQFHGHKGWVRHAIFSPDGKHVLSGGIDGVLRLWPIEGPAEPLFEEKKKP